MPSTSERRNWHIPLSRGEVTLRDAAAELARVGDAPEDIPLIVQIVENPQFGLFPCVADLQTHDFVHVLLGRGLSTKDEAFVLGFTMGSSRRLGPLREKLYRFVSRRLYYGDYRLSGEDLEVFHDAVRLGDISGCRPLHAFDFGPHLDRSLDEVRRHARLDATLLRAYYAIEGRRYPQAPECQRTLH
ncbi:MAG TPA: hypothetical protein VNU97_04745 [Rhizomicrobium sp.]|jgi:hypothetical protein|nr:hypothetical protein [Rhizomicrobium sp.]